MTTTAAHTALAAALALLQRQGYQIDQLTNTLWVVQDPFTRIANVAPTRAIFALADRLALYTHGRRIPDPLSTPSDSTRDFVR